VIPQGRTPCSIPRKLQPCEQRRSYAATFLSGFLAVLFLTACGLTAAQWEGLVDGGIKLACGAGVSSG
jgi:hypothetical protein